MPFRTYLSGFDTELASYPLNQVLRDFEVLLALSDGKEKLAPTLVYAVFKVMKIRGLEIEKGKKPRNGDCSMTKLVKSL